MMTELQKDMGSNPKYIIYIVASLQCFNNNLLIWVYIVGKIMQ